MQRAYGGLRVVRESAVKHHADTNLTPQVGCSRRKLKEACTTDCAGFGVAVPQVRGGDPSVLTVLPEAAEQLPDSPRSEAEDLGGGEAILAVLVASPDGLAHGHGKRTRQRISSLKGSASETCPQ